MYRVPCRWWVHYGEQIYIHPKATLNPTESYLAVNIYILPGRTHGRWVGRGFPCSISKDGNHSTCLASCLHGTSIPYY